MSSSIIHQIDWKQFCQTKITNKTFGFSLVDEIINSDLVHLDWETLGFSFEDLPIRMVKIGRGKIKILLWSQMHGDEPTATAAIFDLINFFTDAIHHQELKNNILTSCTLYFIPVINPDGMEKFTRRNAQQIDINRDFLAQQSPEGKILRTIREKIKPNFAFNLHDQDSLYSIPKSKKTVAISLLAPAFDETLAVNWNREQAIKVIICINEALQKLVPQQVGRFNDEFEPRAFGDNFQKAGAATILIESGSLINDPEKQEIRKLNFYALLSALEVISNQTYQEKDLINYFMIPVQKKELFHVLLKNCSIQNSDKSYKIDIGLNYTDIFDQKTRTLQKHYQVADIGNLSNYNAFETIDATSLILIGEPKFEQIANLELKNTNHQTIIWWKAGIRV
ncbi:M14 family zinc carboxypeptidase [Pedobacter cryophilus]|uniref:DUF2817 domain-containing protein n=1 Tax=Pedobacter cryophilus TaxID=2571271 RepID=A0A4U1BYS3_9SPHI|nr:M14 family zinc carboxypeptidase [Pedobacter cryophilus]TKB97905.1 DUF2817 domain-containing protein [Pedobacter cryophilus]